MTSQSPEPIPGWAKERAAELELGDSRRIENALRSEADTIKLLRQTLARYIAAHEEEPVDPLVDELMRAVGAEFASDCFRAELAKRGLKIVPADSGIELGRADK